MLTKTILCLATLLALVFAGVITNANQESKPAHAVALLETGAFHGEEVSARTGEKWLGLYISEGHSLLVTTRIRVETVHDEIGDAPDEQTGKSVGVDLPLEPLFLVKGAKMLSEGPVNTVFIRNTDSEESLEKISPLQLTLAQTAYELKVVGAADGARCSEHSFLNDAQLVLASGDSSQVLYSLEGCGNDPYWYLMWAGDLDRDGKLDLYVSVTHHYNVSQKKLFLSSKAKKGDLVKEIAEFETYGC